MSPHHQRDAVWGGLDRVGHLFGAAVRIRRFRLWATARVLFSIAWLFSLISRCIPLVRALFARDRPGWISAMLLEIVTPPGPVLRAGDGQARPLHQGAIRRRPRESLLLLLLLRLLVLLVVVLLVLLVLLRLLVLMLLVLLLLLRLLLLLFVVRCCTTPTS